MSPNLVELSFFLSELWAKNLKGGAEHSPPHGQDIVKVFHLFAIWRETHPQTSPEFLTIGEHNSQKNWNDTDPSKMDNL